MSEEGQSEQGDLRQAEGTGEKKIQAQEMPVTILAQYIRDVSFENPSATEVMRGGGALPEMDINIGVDARRIPDEQQKNLYEVILNIKASAQRADITLFLAELQYGVTVTVGETVPEKNHHPLLLIEIPRLAFPFARQVLAMLTVQGGYPPLLLNPVDFHALYMQRFGKEIEEGRKNAEKSKANGKKAG